MLDIVVEREQVALDERRLVHAPRIQAVSLLEVHKSDCGEIPLQSGTG